MQNTEATALVLLLQRELNKAQALAIFAKTCCPKMEYLQRSLHFLEPWNFRIYPHNGGMFKIRPNGDILINATSLYAWVLSSSKDEHVAILEVSHVGQRCCDMRTSQQLCYPHAYKADIDKLLMTAMEEFGWNCTT